MKKTLIMLILAFAGMDFESLASAIQDPQKVIAFSGVRLRTSPHLDAQTITVIPFREQIQLVDTVENLKTIEWLEGNWVKVRFEGREGYIFDGFITDLPIPSEDYELTSRDADISYPLISWTQNNFKIISKPDSIQGTDYVKTTEYFEKGITLTSTEGIHSFEASLHIPGIRLGDAYNLVRTMMLTSTERELFEENTLFIKNNENIIDKVRISIDAPIEIIKTFDGVDIRVNSYQHICG